MDIADLDLLDMVAMEATEGVTEGVTEEATEGVTEVDFSNFIFSFLEY